MLEAEQERENAPTSDRTSARRQRIEVITRGERRRTWTAEQKREIAAESLEPGTSPITVARKHGISSGQLYTWRQQLLRNAVCAAANPAPSFVRVDVMADPPRLGAATPAAVEVEPPAPPIVPPPAQPDGRIEIMLSRGVSVRVDAQVDEGALRRVLAALKRP